MKKLIDEQRALQAELKEDLLQQKRNQQADESGNQDHYSDDDENNKIDDFDEDDGDILIDNELVDRGFGAESATGGQNAFNKSQTFAAGQQHNNGPMIEQELLRRDKRIEESYRKL